MSKLRPGGNNFSPNKFVLKCIGCWDSRKSDAPELMSWGATEPLAGLSHFEKFTQTLPALLNKGKIFSLMPSLLLSRISLA